MRYLASNGKMMCSFGLVSWHLGRRQTCLLSLLDAVLWKSGAWKSLLSDKQSKGASNSAAHSRFGSLTSTPCHGNTM